MKVKTMPPTMNLVAVTIAGAVLCASLTLAVPAGASGSHHDCRITDTARPIDTLPDVAGPELFVAGHLVLVGEKAAKQMVWYGPCEMLADGFRCIADPHDCDQADAQEFADFCTCDYDPDLGVHIVPYDALPFTANAAYVVANY